MKSLTSILCIHGPGTNRRQAPVFAVARERFSAVLMCPLIGRSQRPNIAKTLFGILESAYRFWNLLAVMYASGALMLKPSGCVRRHSGAGHRDSPRRSKTFSAFFGTVAQIEDAGERFSIPMKPTADMRGRTIRCPLSASNGRSCFQPLGVLACIEDAG